MEVYANMINAPGPRQPPRERSPTTLPYKLATGRLRSDSGTAQCVVVDEIIERVTSSLLGDSIFFAGVSVV